MSESFEIELAVTTANHCDEQHSPGEEQVQNVRSKWRLTAILTALSLTLFMAALDATILATAIPTITADFKSATGYFWIGGAYLLANAATAPIWVRISDIWGRKLILLICVALFAGASVIAASSIDIEMLVVARALQGSAGGGLVQLMNITIADIFSQRQRTLFIGICELMWCIAAGIGPILGGTLTELVSWRWCFWINLPISGITFALLLASLNVHNPKTKLKAGVLAVDWFGIVSMLGAIVLVLLGLDFGGVIFPWSSPKVVCLVIVGILMIALFIYSEKHLAKYPLMPLNMFKSRSNIAVFVTCFSHGATYIVAEYYLPLYFQSVKGASPMRSGVLILPITVSGAVTGVLAGVMIHKTGRYRELTWLGMLLLTIGTGLYICLDEESSITEIVGFELLEGIGSGFLWAAPLIAIQSTVSQANTAIATGMFGSIRSIATSMGVVIGGVVFQNGMDAQQSALKQAGLNQTLIDTFTHGEAAAHVDLVAGIQNSADRLAVQAAFARSLRKVWVVFATISGVGLLCSALIEHNDLSRDHKETQTGIEKMENQLESLVER